MKLKSLLCSGLFATVAALSFGVQAADADKAPEAKEQADKAPAKKTKPHSHVEEKSGMAMPESASKAMPESTSETKTQKPKPGQDKTKHLHPRDGK